MRKKGLKKIVLVITAIVFSLYSCYQVYRMVYSPVRTETALFVTATDTIETTGYVIKDEEIISGNTNGVISYLVEDGERVEKNGKIAQLYSSAEDAIVDKQIKSLSTEIDRLNSINYSKNFSSGNPETIDKQIFNNMIGLISDVNKSEFTNICNNRNNLLYSINARQVMTGKVNNFNDRISILKSQKSELEKNHRTNTGEIISPQSGYFVSKIDGYEGKIPYSSALSITPNQLKSSIKPDDISNAKAVGKLMKSPNWYIACLIPSDKVTKLSAGKELTIELPFASTQSIPCVVAAINQPDKNGEAALVLRCDYMSRELSMVRNEPITINVDKYGGIRVSKKSLHESTVSGQITDESGNQISKTQKVKGVYTLYGGELVFKQVELIYADKNYVICKLNIDRNTNLTGKTVQLYDQVVTEGIDLYNGKIIK